MMPDSSAKIFKFSSSDSFSAPVFNVGGTRDLIQIREVFVAKETEDIL